MCVRERLPSSQLASAAAWKECFLKSLERISSLKSIQTVIIDQGWYSEREMREELNWTPL